MAYNDFIIAVDENGQAYIAHDVWGASKYARSNKKHKYLVKIKENGKWRYFYSRDELHAWGKKAHKENPEAYKKAAATAKVNQKYLNDMYKESPEKEWAWEHENYERRERGRKRISLAKENYEKKLNDPKATKEEKARAKRLYESTVDRYGYMFEIF